MSKLTVGQSVWTRLNHAKQGALPKEHKITKVGRRWVYIDRLQYKFDVKTFRLYDGEWDIGEVVLSPEGFEERDALKNTWRVFCWRVNHGHALPRDGVTLADLREAARLLRVDMDES